MKKIFSTITIFLLIFISQKTSLAFAQGVTIDLEARAIGENITILYKGTSSATVQPILSDKEIFSVPTNLTILPGLEPKLAGLTPTTSWQTKKTLAPDTKYYVRIFDIRTKGFLTENTEVKVLSVNLLSANFEKVSAGTYVLAGQIDINKHKDTDPIPYSSIKVSGDIYTKDDSVFILAFPETKVDKDGKYFLNIINNSFNPNTWYEARLSFDSELGARTEKSYSFTTEKGIVPETGKAADNFYDSNSYRLLAPIPGMTALLDPELCKLNQQTNPGEICDINAFLNFILSLIIGIAAVILVIRLIITGYGYMITDVPFVKAKLKGGFKDALLGLIFALASYVILNTINPRLVSNDFTIGKAEFTVEELGTDLSISQIQNSFLQGNLSSNTKEKLSKMPLPSSVYCPGKTGEKGDVSKVALSFLNKVTYNNTPQRGTSGPDGTILLDCSLYVNTVLGCSGVTPKTADYTGDMFNKGEKISTVENKGGVGYVNGRALKPGDLVGVYDPKPGTGAHHVWIYVGNGEILDSQVSGVVKRFGGGSIQGTTAKSVISKERLAEKVYGYKLNFVVRY